MSPKASILVAAVVVAALNCGRLESQCVVGTNSGLSFDGVNDVATVPFSPALNVSSFTLEAWVNVQGFPHPMGAVINRWTQDPALDQYGLWVVPFAPGLAAPFMAVGVADPQGFSAGIMPVGTFVHLAAVFDASTGDERLYVNGNMVGSHQGLSGSLNQSSTPLRLGEDTAGTIRFLQGTIDEVRLWSVARSGAQILAAKDFGLTGNEPGLVGYWRLDETANDQSVLNAAASTGASLNGVLGASSAVGTDDPSRIGTGSLPLPYCPPCPAPPCGQWNSACATLLVNGVGANTQGPITVDLPTGATLSLHWSGAPNQPIVLAASPVLAPGQDLGNGVIVDVSLATSSIVLSGFDPLWGPFYFTNGAGTTMQSFAIPPSAAGSTVRVQGAIWDAAHTCSAAGFMTTASFAIIL